MGMDDNDPSNIRPSIKRGRSMAKVKTMICNISFPSTDDGRGESKDDDGGDDSETETSKGGSTEPGPGSPEAASQNIPVAIGNVGGSSKQVNPVARPKKLFDISTTKEETEVYEIHNLREGRASWKTPQHSVVRVPADLVIGKFKLYEKSRNWLNDYENLRLDILRSMVDTVISERNFEEESMAHEWIIVAIRGTIGPMRATNPNLMKPKIETKQVQVVLRRQPKVNQPATKPAAQDAAGPAGAAQQKASAKVPPPPPHFRSPYPYHASLIAPVVELDANFPQRLAGQSKIQKASHTSTVLEEDWELITHEALDPSATFKETSEPAAEQVFQASTMLNENLELMTKKGTSYQNYLRRHARTCEFRGPSSQHCF